MIRSLRTFAFTVALAASMLASSACGTPVAQPDAVPDRGAVAPPLTLPTVDGTTFDLRESLGAGPVLVVFYRGHW